MLNTVLDYVIGYRGVECDKSFSARVADIMMKNEIRYRNFRAKDDKVEFILNDIQFKKLLSCLESGIPLDTVWQKGLPYVLKRYRKRPGILIGLLLIMTLTKLSTLYVWDISVEGNENISDAEILNTLEELGFSIGSYIPDVDFYGICHQLLLANGNLSWVSVNMEGTGAKVKIIENDKKGRPDDGNGTPSNIVARFDGEIVRTETVSGELVVRAGEQVKAGQLLISGVVEIGQGDTGRFTLMRAKGSIYAKTERVFEVSVPLENVKSVLKERVTVKKSFKFFGKSIKLKENSSILKDSCDIITVNRRLVLFEGIKKGLEVSLPMSVQTVYADIYEDISVTYSEEEALVIAERKLTDLVKYELLNAELLSKETNLVINNGVLTLTWVITCIQDIGVEASIGLV